VDSPAGFASWLARLAEPDPATPIQAGEGRCRYRWIVANDRGLATWAVSRILDKARGLGLDRAVRSGSTRQIHRQQPGSRSSRSGVVGAVGGVRLRLTIDPVSPFY
jgi:hypothetical protein